METVKNIKKSWGRNKIEIIKITKLKHECMGTIFKL